MKNRQKNKTKPIQIISIISCLLFLISAAVLLVQLFALGFIPNKYMMYVCIVLGAFSLLFSLIAFIPKVINVTKILQSILCVLLAGAIIVCNILLPSVVGELEKAFIDIPETTELEVNLYVSNDCQYEKIEEFASKNIGIQTAVDSEYTTYAIEYINKLIYVGDINVIEYTNFYDMIDGFKNGEIEGFLLNPQYMDIIDENEDYLNFSSNVKIFQTVTQYIDFEADTAAVEDITKDPFVVSITGCDSRNKGAYKVLTGGGRTDVNIIAAVNPTTKQIVLVTIPRDSYVPLNGETDKMDKLTHATVYSIAYYKNAIESILDVNINYFARFGFESVISIVDAVGGLDIYNPYYFSEYGIEFEKGNIHLTGEQALYYCRLRHTLSQGDISRNQHQAIIVEAMINKLISKDMLNNASKVLKSIKNSFYTDITTDEIFDLVGMQLDDMASWNIVTCSLSGSGFTGFSYASQCRCYMVQLDQTTIDKANKLINDVLMGKVVE